MNAKRFFYVTAGVLLLAIAYSLGSSRAGAQSGGQFTGIAVNPNADGSTVAITSTGDVYARSASPAANVPGAVAAKCTGTRRAVGIRAGASWATCSAARSRSRARAGAR